MTRRVVERQFLTTEPEPFWIERTGNIIAWGAGVLFYANLINQLIHWGMK